MTKIKFQYNALRAHIIPYLSNSCDYLGRAHKQTTQLSIPRDFKYASQLYELNHSLTQYRGELQTINEKLHNSNKQYDNVSHELSQHLDQIDKIDINKRERIVS